MAFKGNSTKSCLRSPGNYCFIIANRWLYENLPVRLGLNGLMSWPPWSHSFTSPRLSHTRKYLLSCGLNLSEKEKYWNKLKKEKRTQTLRSKLMGVESGTWPALVPRAREAKPPDKNTAQHLHILGAKLAVALYSIGTTLYLQVCVFLHFCRLNGSFD